MTLVVFGLGSTMRVGPYKQQVEYLAGVVVGGMCGVVVGIQLLA